MRNKKGRKGWMIIKIDLEKDYDWLNWEFIRDTLQDIRMACVIVDLIWHCVSSASMSVVEWGSVG